MQYITATREEATIPATEKDAGAMFDAESKDYYILKEGYEKWAYVYKKVIPDTEEEIVAREYEAAIKSKEAEILRRQAIAEITAEKAAEIG